MRNLIDQFPQLYHSFLPSVFFDTVPDETLATCHDCVMCKDHLQKKASGEKYFIPDTKCCTYQPHLPNYLVGGLLTQPLQEEGRKRMLQYISNKVGVTPLAVKPSTRFSKEYNAFKKMTFGKNKAFKCFFFESETGNCTIYPYWNGICSTWFCKSVGEDVGHAFWNSTRDVLRTTEELLTRFTAKELGLKPKTLHENRKAIRPDNLQGEVDEKLYQHIWGKWLGKEAQFYQEAYKLVTTLSPQAFEEIANDQYRQQLLEMEKKKEQFKEYAS